MIDLKILYVTPKNTIAFQIDFNIYYLVTSGDFHKLYDDSLQQLTVFNMDHWFQAQTGQRYSYQQVLDMGKAFRDGFTASYSYDELKDTCLQGFFAGVDQLFQSIWLQDYLNYYWIETLPPDKLMELANDVCDQSSIINKLPKPKLHDVVCRIFKTAKIHKINNITAMCHKIIQSHKLPPLNEALISKKPDALLFHYLSSKIVKCRLYKNVDSDIVNKAESL